MGSRKKSIVKFALLIIIIAALIVLAKYTGLGKLLNVEYVRGVVDNAGIYGPLIFILVYFAVTVTFLPGTPFTIASGVLFGTLSGGLYTVIGATLGATVAFIIARFFGGDFVERILKDKFNKLYEYDEKIEKNGFLVMLFFRLVPLFPFNGLNFAMGLTKIKFKHYFLATFLGIIPGTFILANIGGTSSDVMSPQFIFSIVLFVLLILILPIYKYAKKKFRKAKA